MTDSNRRLPHRLRRAAKADAASFVSDGPAFPERVQHHLVAFEIESGDDIEAVVAVRSHGSVYNFSHYVSQGKRTLTLPTERWKRAIKPNCIVGVTVIDSWKGTSPEWTFDTYGDVFERHGWTERTAYPGTNDD